MRNDKHCQPSRITPACHHSKPHLYTYTEMSEKNYLHLEENIQDLLDLSTTFSYIARGN